MRRSLGGRARRGRYSLRPMARYSAFSVQTLSAVAVLLPAVLASRASADSFQDWLQSGKDPAPQASELSLKPAELVLSPAFYQDGATKKEEPAAPARIPFGKTGSTWVAL